MSDSPSPRFMIRHFGGITPTPCPCGTSRRAFTDDPDRIASMHVVEIKADAETHYHRRTTELYYILEGAGEIELDGQRFPIQAGSAILIKPGCRHRAIGQLKVLNVPVPAFDPADEFVE